LSGIADRYRVSVSELMRMNNLRSRHFIRAGQVLRLPQSIVRNQVKRELVDGTYRVQRGDTLSVIAEAFGVSEGQLASQNNLSSRHSIQVDQVLIVAAAEPESEPDAVETVAEVLPEVSPPAESLPEVEAVVEPASETLEESPVAVEPPTLSADPSNYLILDGDTAVVHAGETLGHFAEWLDLRAGDLRRINGLKFGQAIKLNSRLRLSFSAVDKETFEARRIAYHRNIQEAYFAQYRIAGVESRVIRRGDSVWELTHYVYKVPLWLFLQYNPDLDIDRVAPGNKVLFPKVEQKPVS
jgi:membrane-bound lytic murein transglycosylase D